MRPWVLGDNMVEVVGSDVTDGISGRVSDPVTGAGLFNPNMDPATVGVDPLTGSDAPEGTDMSFGAMVRRQVHTNVINGDFAVLPPDGADSVIVSDPDDADFNPLPGWTWTPPSDGNQSIVLTADPAYASGYKLALTGASISGGQGELSQLIAVPRSQGQQYRSLLSVYCGSPLAFESLKWQYLTEDLSTIGSEVTSNAQAAYETKVDAGLVPPTAAWLRIKAVGNTIATTGYAGEVRCAFTPAEVTIGLDALTDNSGAITTGETVVASIRVPANSWTVGSTYRVFLYGTVTDSTPRTVTIRVRIGTVTTGGTVVTSNAPTTTGTATNRGFVYEAVLTCRSVGASGSVFGAGWFTGDAQPFANPTGVDDVTSATTVDTTVSELVELSVVTSNADCSVNVRLAYIQCVMAS